MSCKTTRTEERTNRSGNKAEGKEGCNRDHWTKDQTSSYFNSISDTGIIWVHLMQIINIALIISLLYAHITSHLILTGLLWIVLMYIYINTVDPHFCGFCVCESASSLKCVCNLKINSYGILEVIHRHTCAEQQKI